MIIIQKPEIKTETDSAIISSKFIFDGKEDLLWYKFPIKFKDYLVTENIDAFLVGLLFLGLKTGNDIQLEAPISARLFYTINHYLIPALCLANPNLKNIKLLASELNNEDLNVGKTAGTGMSCGIDSFATYYDHIYEKRPNKIDYFTYFNVGSHLDFGGEKARNIYNNRLKSILDFAKMEGKEVIAVDSNLSEILKMNFQQTNSLRSISCVLHLQKLFKNYYFSSSYRFDHFKMNVNDTSDSDILNLQMLSTESTNFFTSAAQFSRVERTLMIAEHPETYKKLDVCVDPSLKSSFINCSSCFKCLRTQLTLDLGNKLHQYENVFDIEKYNKIKEKYIGELLIKKKKSVFEMEIIDFLKRKNFKPSIWVYYYGVTYLGKRCKKKIKKFLKNQVHKTSN